MIPYGQHTIDEDDIQAVVNTLRSNNLTQGPAVSIFEESVAKYVGAKYAVAVSSGSTALHIAAQACGIGPGDSIVTSPITFVATSNSSLYLGARPIFCDIDPCTINLSTSHLLEIIETNDSVKAIFPVHFAGLPCDMEAISQISSLKRLYVVEDAAHALGGMYPNGSKIGSCQYSDMTIFSFHPVKSIAAGEGGLITTNSIKLYKRLRQLRSHGINKSDDSLFDIDAATTDDLPNPWYYEMQDLGYNYRITDIQCALASSQLTKLDTFVALRKALVQRYDKLLSDLPFIEPAQNIGYRLKTSAHHIYPVRINYDKVSRSRAAIMNELKSSGIGTQVHYIPVPLHPYYRSMGYTMSNLGSASGYYSEALTLPLFPHLTFLQQDLIIDSLKKILLS